MAITRIKAPETVPDDVLELIEQQCEHRYPDYMGYVDVYRIDDGVQGSEYDDCDYSVEVTYARQGWRAIFGVTDGDPVIFMD